MGAFKQVENERPLKISTENYQDGKLKIVASRSHSTGALMEFLNKVGKYEYVSMGSSLKLCLVADGTAHLYPRLGPTMEWDTAAAHAVVVEAGGSVTGLEGKPLAYNKPSLLNPSFIVCGKPPFPWRKFLY